MSKKERALPKPNKTPFGRSRHEEEGQDDLLMADQMAMASAEGRLNEYLEQEMPEGEYAKKLARMMMGMTGILPPEEVRAGSSETGEAEKPDEGKADQPVPEDVVKAVHDGDVEKLKDLLAREQHRRDPQQDEISTEEKIVEQQPQSDTVLEKAMLDELLKVAADNRLSVDWLMARALKLYLEEYRKTGRL